MRISCEKCATTYALDDRLIPATGAPVQCTRCGHVFTAYPPGATPARPVITAAPVGEENEGSGKTQPFGKLPQWEDARPRSTQMFGAASASQPLPAIPSSTQVFGTVRSAPLGSEPPRSTQMFGATPAAPAPESGLSAAQLFGVDQPAPSSEPPRSSTQMFGATPAPAPSPQQRPATQVFGAAISPAPSQPAPRSSTQMFGAATATAPAPQPPRSSTQMFGAAPVSAPQPARSSTQLFGAATAPAVSPGSTPAHPRSSTQMFAGAPAAPRPPAPAAEPPLQVGAPTQSSTQQFGISDVQAAIERVEAENAPGRRQSSTLRMDRDALERALDSKSATEPELAGPTEPEFPRTPEPLRVRPSAMPTPYAAPITTPDPYADDVPQDDDQGLTMGDPATAPTFPKTPAVALPPEQLPFLSQPEPQIPLQAGDDEGSELRRQLRRRNRMAMAFISLVVIGAGGAFGFREWQARRTAATVELNSRLDAILNLLHRDDLNSRSHAMRDLHELSAAHPALVEAHSNLLLALALELDDQRLVIKRYQIESEVLNRRIAKLQEEKSPSDWTNRVNAMIDQLQAIKRENDPRTEQAEKLDKELGTELKLVADDKLQKSEREQRAAARALAVYYGVKGSEQALALAERYQGTNKDDGWHAVALAEYALNARVSPQLAQEAAAALDAVIQSDSAFLRAYVLSARLSMQDKRYDFAVNSLEATVALDPSHEVARKLLGWALEAQRLDASVAP